MHVAVTPLHRHPRLRFTYHLSHHHCPIPVIADSLIKSFKKFVGPISLFQTILICCLRTIKTTPISRPGNSIRLQFSGKSCRVSTFLPVPSFLTLIRFSLGLAYNHYYSEP
ncbi:hypothetical protein CIPAW_04G034100 [Carya illinoinensis]|uniref:Uncharacterized protein n=1 Tax=Carya illinoinensis TaxID=32201 RepID=A0A8T1QR00_CARIL|nr:hypothetical protein CIPAW_04G034100 [Carya illinoinensis]